MFAVVNKTINIKNMAVSNHAIKRIKQRFGIDDEHVISWARQRAQYSTFVSIATDQNGHDARMFVCNRVALLFALDSDTLITVFEPRKHQSIAEKVTSFITGELRKEEAKKEREIRRLIRFQTELEIEEAELKLKLLNAKSLPRRIALQARINALRIRIDELALDVHNEKRDRTKIARGAALYV